MLTFAILAVCAAFGATITYAALLMARTSDKHLRKVMAKWQAHKIADGTEHLFRAGGTIK